MGLDPIGKQSHIDYNRTILMIMSKALSFYGCMKISQGNFGLRVSHPKYNWINGAIKLTLTGLRIYLLYEFLTSIMSDAKIIFRLSLTYDFSTRNLVEFISLNSYLNIGFFYVKLNIIYDYLEFSYRLPSLSVVLMCHGSIEWLATMEGIVHEAIPEKY